MNARRVHAWELRTRARRFALRPRVCRNLRSGTQRGTPVSHGAACATCAWGHDERGADAGGRRRRPQRLPNRDAGHGHVAAILATRRTLDVACPSPRARPLPSAPAPASRRPQGPRGPYKHPRTPPLCALTRLPRSHPARTAQPRPQPTHTRTRCPRKSTHRPRPRRPA